MTTPVFAKAPATADFPAMENEILKLWDEIHAFEESNTRREQDGKPFVFYDGPPFATGTPHYGHLLAGTIKDIVPRFWNMRGHTVERRFGWDCHGLPIEALAQESLGLAGTAAIHEAGIDTFNEQCRSMVQTYVGEWRKTVKRMGRWVDFDNDYKTMDPSFMESVWWVFKQLWDKKRIYRAHRIMPYSWKLTTPLSNFEANSNYKDVQDPAITIRCKLKTHNLQTHGTDVYALAWTTTPWTLPSNLALCVGPAVRYALVQDTSTNDLYILAEDLVSSIFKKEGSCTILSTHEGSDLAGWTYEPLFPYFADHENAFQILLDDYVSTDAGTGIVHQAPAYGEDDYRICRAANIELIDPLDDDARFTDLVPDFAGQFCKDADKAIIKTLKDNGTLVHQATINHSYPFCERTETPLIYRAISAWYVKVEDMRDQLVDANEEITWIPEYVGAKRFGNWLKDANDWNISRNRFWGSCIPIWINIENPDDMLCIGSVDELEELSGVRVDDLHKHIVDDVLIKKDGKTYKRTPEVLDCWFESGSMPFAQQHFPFSGKELEDFFPADFIAEGLDQTRGWFYTLLILSTTLFGKSCYKNVVVNGMILAEDGHKMSKRKKNYPDPNEVLHEYGADALRAYMINSPVVRAEELRFAGTGLKEILRTVVIPYWNALSFFTTYANVDNFDPRTWDAPAVADRPDLDRWIISMLQSLVRDVNTEMEQYRLYNVIPRLVRFIDDLTNWYIRSSRRRFWKSDSDSDKCAAYATLYDVLITFAKVLAPFMPFVTEEVYQRLVRTVDADADASIHWTDYPQANESLIDNTIEEQMTVIRAAASLGRKIREDNKIKVRQPLASVTIVHRDESIRQAALDGAERLKSELNVKNILVDADEHSFATVSVKPNFKVLGKRCGAKLKDIGAALSTWSFTEVAKLEAGETITVAEEALGIDDVLLQRSAKDGAAVATDGFITVVLDTQLDDTLEKEGIARELISTLQNARKDKGFDITDRVNLQWSSADQTVISSLKCFEHLISTEVLAHSIEQAEIDGTEATLNGRSLTFALSKS